MFNLLYKIKKFKTAGQSFRKVELSYIVVVMQNENHP